MQKMMMRIEFLFLDFPLQQPGNRLVIAPLLQFFLHEGVHFDFAPFAALDALPGDFQRLELVVLREPELR